MFAWAPIVWNIENCLYKVLVLIRNVCKVGQMHRRRSREQSIFQLACLSHYSIYKHCDFNKTWKRELLNREIYLRQHQRTNSFYYYQQGKSLDWGWNWNFYVGSNKSVSINKLLVTCLWSRNYRITPIRRWRDNSCINRQLFWYCHKHFSMPQIPGNN